MSQKKKREKKQKERKQRDELTLEAKVRAIKLWNIDEWEPEDIIEHIEKTFGIKIADSNWERPNGFLERIQEGLIQLYTHEGTHRLHLIKLLTQAGLIQNIEDNVEEG